MGMLLNLTILLFNSSFYHELFYFFYVFNLKVMIAFNLFFHLVFISFVSYLFFVGLTLKAEDIKENKEDPDEESFLWVSKIFLIVVSVLPLVVYLYYTEYSITQLALLFAYVLSSGLFNYIYGYKIFCYFFSEDHSYFRKFLFSLIIFFLSLIYWTSFWVLWSYLLQV